MEEKNENFKPLIHTICSVLKDIHKSLKTHTDLVTYNPTAREVV